MEPRELEWIEEEFDTVEEVEAVFRAQRRLSFLYGGVFFALTLTIPLLMVFSDSWNQTRVLGGLTLNWLVVAVLYHVIYLLVGIAYTLQANRVEEAMLGRSEGGRRRA